MKLILSTPLGKIEDGFVIGHRSESMIFPVEVSYVENPDKTIGYRVMNWDRSSKLIIDPPLSLTWATYYGGSANDVGYSLATDASGNVYVTGWTEGGTFPLQNPGGGAYYQGTYGGGIRDAFILKFTNSGVRQWATYYGGDQPDRGYSIATDVYGNVFVTGETSGGSFPLQLSGYILDYYQGTYGGGTGDIFILRFTSAGVRQWATFYGGSGWDRGYYLTIDRANSFLYVTGYTTAGSFPLWDPGSGAYYQGTYGGGSQDAFILKFAIFPPFIGGGRVWATYYGGNSSDAGYSIATDASSNIYVTGFTEGGSFPLQTLSGAYYQGTHGGGNYDAFILKFTNSGVRQWATFYGGSANEVGYSLATDASDNVFVTGVTTGGTFPLQNPGGGAYYQGTYGGGTYDAFILKFTNTGARQWATYYGGSARDEGYSLATDASGNVFLTGLTVGGSFPLQNPGGGAYYQGTFGGAADVFILKFTNSGVRQWATFYGGSAGEGGYSLATDASGNVFLTGETGGGTFPLQNPGSGAYYQGTFGGGTDAFILRFEGGVVSVKPISTNIPESYRLHQNHPNPFNPVTKIRFDIPEERAVKLVIYDISGKELSVAVNQILKAGSYEYTFDAGSLTSGIYFYRLEAGEFTETRKMILVK